jgi:hypothetical protein
LTKLKPPSFFSHNTDPMQFNTYNYDSIMPKGSSLEGG